MWFHDILSKNRKILALSPMAGMTDSPFCRIVRAVGGADVVFREMVRSDGLVRMNQRTLRMTDFVPDEGPIVQQIFGADPDTVARAAAMVMEYSRPAGIDINMGCPAHKLTRHSHGCALMQEPERAARIVREVKQAIGDTALSVKIRLGWSDPDQFKEFIPLLEEAGADLITLHGRTKAQGFGGASDWERIAEAKEIATVPLLANGDIHEPPQVREILRLTGADGVLIARGALGNPWFFRQVHTLSGATEDPNRHRWETPVPLEERLGIILEHARLHVAHHGKRGMASFRKHLAWYFKENKMGFGVRRIKEFRVRAVQVQTIEELSGILHEFHDYCRRLPVSVRPDVEETLSVETDIAFEEESCC